MVIRATSLGCLVALALTGQPTLAVAATSCADDGDCKGVLLCREQRCVPVHCKRDKQCPAGRMCHRELCRVRQCYLDADCDVSRRCREGLCALPQPPKVHRKGQATGWFGEMSGFRFFAGAWFPIGAMVQLEAPVVVGRHLTLAIGSDLIDGGVNWKIGIRGKPLKLGSVELDLWAAVMGLNDDPIEQPAGDDSKPSEASIQRIATASGRFLMMSNRDVHPIWWGAGGAIGWRHGAKRRRLLRLNLGGLLLFRDRYPANRDFAVLPSVAIQYGIEL